MSRHELIEVYLLDLRGLLPADVVDELTDGLIETYDRFRGCGLGPDDAALAALADFGAAGDIVTAFTQITPGRRTARTLLATGPLLGGCWAIALLTGDAGHWPIPAAARLAFAALLVTVIALLATTARACYLRARRAAALAGTSGLLLLDTTAIITASALTQAPTWPLLLALAASLTRVCLTAPALRGLLTTR
jgi:hypothetical protein